MKKIALKTEDLSMLTQALAHLLHAGVGPADALYLLSEDL